MKNFIALCIFAIGFLTTLPQTSSGSNAPPGQSCFITDYSVAPAIAVAQEIAFVNQFNQLAPVPEFIEGQEEGGYTIEKSLNTLLDTGNTNKDVIVNATDFTLIPDYALKTYLIYKGEVSQSTYIKNNVSTHRFARDGLTCRV